MRISQGRRGCLAVAALAAFGAANGYQNVYVNFNTGFEGSFDDRAIINRIGPTQLSFGWTSQNVTVSEVRLFGFSSASSKASPIGCGKRAGEPNAQLLDSGTCDEAYRNEDEYVTGAVRRRDPQGLLTGATGNENSDIRLTVVSNAAGGQVTVLDVQKIRVELLFFKAMWGDGGSSYSRVFAISSSNAISNKWLSMSDPPIPESGTPTGTPSSETKDGTNAQPTSTASATPTENSNGSLQSGVGGHPTTPQESPVNGNGSGLAQAAIIGIAVGCGVAGLLLICGLVWYLLRRRRQQKAMHPVGSPYGPGSRGEELMAEKEAGADVDVAPHSPYSDDGGAASGPGAGARGSAAHGGEAVAAGAVAAHPHLQDPPQSFTPYSDRPSAGGAAAAGTPSVRAASVAQTDEPRVRVPSPVPGRATPRGLTTPYAHLVEEGMTEDEIRRLEEEERQLDAAIEQAGRR